MQMNSRIILLSSACDIFGLSAPAWSAASAPTSQAQIDQMQQMQMQSQMAAMQAELAKVRAQNQTLKSQDKQAAVPAAQPDTKSDETTLIQKVVKAVELNKETRHQDWRRSPLQLHC